MTLAEKAIELLDISLHRPVFVIIPGHFYGIHNEFKEAAEKDGRRCILLHRMTPGKGVPRFRQDVLKILNRELLQVEASYCDYFGWPGLPSSSRLTAGEILPQFDQLAFSQKFILLIPRFDQEMEPMINSLVEYDDIRLIVFSFRNMEPTFKRYSRSWKQKFAFINLEDQANIDAINQQ